MINDKRTERITVLCNQREGLVRAAESFFRALDRSSDRNLDGIPTIIKYRKVLKGIEEEICWYKFRPYDF